MFSPKWAKKNFMQSSDFGVVNGGEGEGGSRDLEVRRAVAMGWIKE